MCKRSTAYLTGIQVTDTVYRLYERYHLPCNSFQCPECSPYLTKQLRARIFNGDMVKDVHLLSKYSAKFFTLTLPGTDQGRYQINPADWISILQQNFNRLMTAVRKKYGKMYYMRVTEPHKDGIPHLHVLFVSPAIISKTFLDYVENLWRNVYGMGFVKAKVIWDLQHGIYYITKYLTKGIRSLKKYQRIFSVGRNTIMKKIKKKNRWISHGMVFGCMENDGSITELPIKDLEGFQDAIAGIRTYEEFGELFEIIKENGRVKT